MGRKDAPGTHSAAPVDRYRKQIGKQDWKKSKKDMKSLKSASDLKKTGTTQRDVFIITGTILAVVLAMYGFMFWYLFQEKTIGEKH